MNKNCQKIVQNYIIESISYTAADGSQILMARHKVLKKKFTLKKVSIQGSFSQSIKQKRVGLTREEWQYQNLLREVSMLKRHSCQSMPKCHKIIKTTHSIYLVYDQFPQRTLASMLQGKLTRLEKIQLILQIARQVDYFHGLGIVLLNITTNSILIYDEKMIFLRDWSLARPVEDGCLHGYQYITQGREFMSQQFLEKGTYNFGSDIYSMGKIFDKILHSNIQSSTEENLKLDELVKSMITENEKDRIKLSQIIKILEKIKSNTGRRQTPGKIKFIMLEKIPTERDITTFSNQSVHLHKEEESNKIKDIPILYQNYSLRDQIIESSRISRQNTERTDKDNKMRLLQINQSRITQSSTRKSRASSIVSIQEIDINIKSTCQQRNLSFFILSLAEFVVKSQLCIELAYLLTKLARLNIKKVYIRLIDKQFGEAQEKVNKLIAILKKEEGNIRISEELFKKWINIEQTESNLRRELKDDTSIIDRYLKEKIIEFSKEMVVVCDQQMTSNAQQEDLYQNLFTTFIVLKAVEMGSYEKFWEKTSQTDQRYLVNPSLMKGKGAFSNRFLKSKIAQILYGK